MPRSPFSRPTRDRTPGPKFLIACEGDGEKAYLEAIRQSLRLSNKQIVVFERKGYRPPFYRQNCNRASKSITRGRHMAGRR